jgi:hypothetical protein
MLVTVLRTFWISAGVFALEFTRGVLFVGAVFFDFALAISPPKGKSAIPASFGPSGPTPFDRARKNFLFFFALIFRIPNPTGQPRQLLQNYFCLACNHLHSFFDFSPLDSLFLEAQSLSSHPPPLTPV